MQWSDGHDAGFTDGDPWIKVTENYPEVNVERAREDPRSVWHYYRELVALNFSEARPDAVLPADVGYEHDEADLLAGNYDDADGREPLAFGRGRPASIGSESGPSVPKRAGDGDNWAKIRFIID